VQVREHSGLGQLQAHGRLAHARTAQRDEVEHAPLHGRERIQCGRGCAERDRPGWHAPAPPARQLAHAAQQETVPDRVGCVRRRRAREGLLDDIGGSLLVAADAAREGVGSAPDPA
jgi:hypothetical protein